MSIKEHYHIGLTYTSNALKGNSLTETETKIVLEEGLTVGGKPLRDYLEAVGHSQAFDFLYTLINKSILTEHDIKALHRLFYYRIDEQYAGIYRTVKVFITGSKYPLPAPDRLTTLMQEFIAGLAQEKKSLHPVTYAARVHKDFVFIHPFVDGNGRVARLLMNLVLLQAGYPITIIPPIMRSEYIRTLEKAHVDEHDFMLFIAGMVKETQKDYLRLFIQ
jgi:cell filamentation protein, protein adenylyltransferase